MADAANNLWSFGYGDIGAWGGGQRFNFAVHTGSGVYADFSSANISIRPNTWHHAAVVRSGTTFTFYFDGVQAGTAAVGAGFAINGGSTGAIIGARYNNNPSITFEYTNGMLDEVSVYKRTASAGEISAIYNAGAAGKLKSAASPVNLSRSSKTAPAALAPTTVQLSDATVTFQQVSISGFTSENGVDLGLLPPLPTGAIFSGLAYDISTTAIHQNGSANDVKVCFNVPSLTSIPLAQLRIYHLEGSTWVNRRAAGDSYAAVCTTGLTSLSPFAIAQFVPTAAPVSISGRVLTSDGRGINGAVITMSDAAGHVRTARTGAFGYYQFDNVGSGENYVLAIGSKRFTFAEPVRFVNAVDDVADVDFVANE